jgi:hypothetical protein
MRAIWRAKMGARNGNLAARRRKIRITRSRAAHAGPLVQYGGANKDIWPLLGSKKVEDSLLAGETEIPRDWITAIEASRTIKRPTAINETGVSALALEFKAKPPFVGCHERGIH